MQPAFAVKLSRAVRVGGTTNSVLQTIANHREPDGQLLDQHTAGVELLNVLRPTVAVSLYITFIAHALHVHPEYRQRIEAGELGFANSFAQEVRRWYPFFPSVVALARRDFEWKGYKFRKATRVVLDLHGTNHDLKSWDSPDVFDPDRFQRQHAESTHTQGSASENDVTAGCPFHLVPQGGGDHTIGHRCPGEWITLALMTMAARMLTTRLDYDVPPQDLRIDSTRLPAVPRSRFVIERVRIRNDDALAPRQSLHFSHPT